MYLTHLPAQDSSCHVFKAPHDASFPCLPSSVTNHLHSTHASIYFPLSVFSSHRCIICAYHCCFSAWFSSSSAWMNSYQIKLALADSDLPTPPLHAPPHTRIPRVHPSLSSPTPLLLSFFWHFGSFCHLRGPAEHWGASVAQGGCPKIPVGPYVYIHKGPEYFLQRCCRVVTEKGSLNFAPAWISQNAAL